MAHEARRKGGHPSYQLHRRRTHASAGHCSRPEQSSDASHRTTFREPSTCHRAQRSPRRPRGPTTSGRVNRLPRGQRQLLSVSGHTTGLPAETNKLSNPSELTDHAVGTVRHLLVIDDQRKMHRMSDVQRITASKLRAQPEALEPSGALHIVTSNVMRRSTVKSPSAILVQREVARARRTELRQGPHASSIDTESGTCPERVHLATRNAKSHHHRSTKYQ